MILSYEKKPRGYFDDDERIDQLYRLIDIQAHTFTLHALLISAALFVAMVAFVVAVLS